MKVPTKTLKKWTGLLLTVSLAACATSKNFGTGEVAEEAGRYDEAVNYYARAVSEDPSNREYRRSLQRAKARASQAHAKQAANLRAAGDLEAAKDEMELAVAFNPGDANLVGQLQEIETAIEHGREAAAENSIAAMKKLAKERPLGLLHLAPEADEPAGFLFRDANLRDVFLSIGKMAGVNIVFDGEFTDRNISIELHDADFEDALRSLCRITNNFYRVEADNIVIVIPDTQAKRREYQQTATKTFYLSNSDLKETIDLLRIVLGARRIAPHTVSNALTIVDTPEKIAAAERIIHTLDQSRAEVMIEVELLEVKRSRLDEYGIQLTSALQGTEGVATALVPQQGTLDQSLYSSSNISVTGLPGAVLRLLKNDSDTRILASPKLRAVDGQVARVEFGDRVPVPITTFTPIASGGVAQQPVTTFEYENVGVNVEIVPRIHHNDEISMELTLRLSAISGTGFGGLPTFGNRTVNTLLRLGDGETNLLAGLIREEERTSLTGTPGLSSIPVLGRLFSVNKKEVQETDVVLTLTPRVIRRVGVSVDDLKSYVIEGGVAGMISYEAPTTTPRTEPRPQEPRLQ